jgi:hypothetical protein
MNDSDSIWELFSKNEILVKRNTSDLSSSHSLITLLLERVKMERLYSQTLNRVATELTRIVENSKTEQT